jgi:hypothetical protein
VKTGRDAVSRCAGEQFLSLAASVKRRLASICRFVREGRHRRSPRIDAKNKGGIIRGHFRPSSNAYWRFSPSHPQS